METRDVTSEMEKARDDLLDLLALDAKPSECAETFAAILDKIPGLSDWARRLREAKYDGDRLAQVMDEFHIAAAARPEA